VRPYPLPMQTKHPSVLCAIFKIFWLIPCRNLIFIIYKGPQWPQIRSGLFSQKFAKSQTRSHCIFGRSLRGHCKCHFFIGNTADIRLHRWFAEDEQQWDSQIRKNYEAGSGFKDFVTGVGLKSGTVTPANCYS